MCQQKGNMMSNFCGNIDTSVPKTAEVTRVRYAISAEVTPKQLFLCGSSAEVTPVFAEVTCGSKPPYPLHVTSVDAESKCLRGRCAA